MVELIDLYPTLCDMVGLPIPNHCQGRSFRKLVKDPEVGHRYDAYSSYPAYESTGHSIRFKNYRYTEWRDINEVVKANVLTDLTADPGEETNVKDSKSYVAALAYTKERLQVRINQALESSYAKENEKSLPPVVSLALDHQQIGQKIRGFGVPLPFGEQTLRITQCKMPLSNWVHKFYGFKGRSKRMEIANIPEMSSKEP